MVPVPTAAVSSEIVKLRQQDVTNLQALLRGNKLPDDDCVEQAQHIWVIYHEGQIVAAGGLQPAGNCALLRSVVVRADHRGQGVAKRIIDFLLRQAEADGLAAVYLLTKSGKEYFQRLGFKVVDRADAPTEITHTRQFSSICPASANCLCLSLPRA